VASAAATAMARADWAETDWVAVGWAAAWVGPDSAVWGSVVLT